MRTATSFYAAVVLFLSFSASLGHAGTTQTVNSSCENAIAKATFLAAQRKRVAVRPYPTAPVLNLESNRNYAKTVLLPLGEVWSHKKFGELAFDVTGETTCSVTSNGHPADVILSDLVKTFGHATVRGLSATPARPSTTTATADIRAKTNNDCAAYESGVGAHSALDCHGNPKR
jgi:hypothetical protein